MMYPIFLPQVESNAPWQAYVVSDIALVLMLLILVNWERITRLFKKKQKPLNCSEWEIKNEWEL